MPALLTPPRSFDTFDREACPSCAWPLVNRRLVEKHNIACANTGERTYPDSAAILAATVQR